MTTLRHTLSNFLSAITRQNDDSASWLSSIIFSIVMSRQLSLIFDKSHVEYTAEEKRENSTESWFGAYPVSFLINSVPRVLTAVVRRQHLLPVHACKGVVPAFYLSSVSGSGGSWYFQMVQSCLEDGCVKFHHHQKWRLGTSYLLDRSAS